MLAPELAERARVETLATAKQLQRQIIETLTFHVASSSCRAKSVAANEGYAPHALLVVGGTKNTCSTSDVLSYELSSGRWQSSAALPAARSGTGIASLDGLVYVVGGYDGSRCHSNTFMLDVSRGSWSSGPSLTTARCRRPGLCLGSPQLGGVVGPSRGRLASHRPHVLGPQRSRRRGAGRPAVRRWREQRQWIIEHSREIRAVVGQVAAGGVHVGVQGGRGRGRGGRRAVRSGRM